MVALYSGNVLANRSSEPRTRVIEDLADNATIAAAHFILEGFAIVDAASSTSL